MVKRLDLVVLNSIKVHHYQHYYSLSLLSSLSSLIKGDTISGEVNRADVAECAVAAAISKTIPSRVIFEMYQAGKSGPLEGKFKSTSGYERNGPKLGNTTTTITITTTIMYIN